MTEVMVANSVMMAEVRKQKSENRKQEIDGRLTTHHSDP
jgi:hypothetical protein